MSAFLQIDWQCKMLCKKILRSFSESNETPIYWIISATFTKTFFFRYHRYSKQNTTVRKLPASVLRWKHLIQKKKTVGYLESPEDGTRHILKCSVCFEYWESKKKVFLNASDITQIKPSSKYYTLQLKKYSIWAQYRVSDCYSWRYIDTTIIQSINRVKFIFMTQGARQNPRYSY